MPSFGFIMEQTLGHVTHHQNLARQVARETDIAPAWMPVIPDQSDLWDRLPGVRGNWSLKGSLRARDALRTAEQTQKLDALFIHTQTLALFATRFMRRIPTIVSLDATPINYDTVGEHYGHIPSKQGWMEKRKFEWNRATFREARALVTWCQWAKTSLVDDYGIPGDKVTVIPPGIDMAQWTFPRPPGRGSATPSGRLRLLLVGGDFARKGGHVLLDAFANGLQSTCELDIVTKDEAVRDKVQQMEGVRVHYGLTANCDPLRDLYARADCFVFPTLGDCLPLAIMEAMAAGLPIVTTNVGALGEQVEAGMNGLVVPPSDAHALVEAVQSLVADPVRRETMGRAGRCMAEERFDAQRNYRAVLGLLRQIADQKTRTI